jgi:hypothetical protein
VAVIHNRERSWSQVGFKTGASSVGDAEPVALEKGAVVDGVKGSRHIDRTDSGDVLAGGCTDEMIIHRGKSSFI